MASSHAASLSLPRASTFAFALALAVSLAPALAKADDARQPRARVRVAVAWLRAPGAGNCIAPEELVERLRARAPAGVLVTLERSGADFVVIGDIAPEDTGFRTDIELRDAEGRPLGERSLDTKDASCRALDESLVLALLLLVETQVQGAPPAPPAPPAPRSEAMPELVPPLRPALLPRRRGAPLRLAPPRWRVDVGAGAALGVGVAPKPAAGATLFAAITPPRLFPFVVRASAYPFGVDALTVPREGITIRAFEIGADACPLEIARGRFEGLVCGGARAWFSAADPLGPQSSSGSLFFFTLPLRAEGRLRLPNGLAFYAATTVALSPLSPSFTYRANGEAHTSFEVSHVTVELELGLAWRASP